MDTSVSSTSASAKKKRRALLAIEKPSPLGRITLNSTPSVALEEADDERQRSNRRNIVEMHRRVSNIVGRMSANESARFVGHEAIKEHFMLCNKLFNENKITPKNAWKLHIIDYLRDLITDFATSEGLQVACASLDICTKVYSVRVDDLYTEGMKLANTLARMMERHEYLEGNKSRNDEPEEDGQTGPVNEEQEEQQQKKKKKKRMSRANKYTISKDLKALTAPLPKLNSVFFSTRTNAEASAIDNLFTNTLKMDNCGCKFMLLSKEKAWVCQPDPILKGHDNPNRSKYPLRVSPFPVKICAPFRDFYVNNKWNPEEEEKQMAADKSSQWKIQDEVVYDDDGIPIHEVDGPIRDIFEDNPHDDALGPDDEGGIILHAQEKLERIVHLIPEAPVGTLRSEYSYNVLIRTSTGQLVDKIWAGPSHWKLKCIRSTPSMYSGHDAERVDRVVNKPRGKKKDPGLINLEVEIPEHQLTTKFVIKKKPPVLEFNQLIVPLPPKCCDAFILELPKLMTKDEFCPVREKRATNDMQVDYDEADNPVDDQYCPNELNDDGPENEDCPTGDNQDEAVMRQPENFLGDNLIAAPETVPKFYVPYALKPKKLDMKKLKAAIWRTLTNTAVDKNVMISRGGTVVPTTFSKMYRALPLILSEKLRKDLSCPMVFSALLHLCNEEGLTLKQHDNVEDFDILGPDHA